MSDITIHSASGKIPAVLLQPGNTLAVKLANCDAIVVFKVPVNGPPWVDVYGNDGKVNKMFVFRLDPQPVAEAGLE